MTNETARDSAGVVFVRVWLLSCGAAQFRFGVDTLAGLLWKFHVAPLLLALTNPANIHSLRRRGHRYKRVCLPRCICGWDVRKFKGA